MKQVGYRLFAGLLGALLVLSMAAGCAQSAPSGEGGSSDSSASYPTKEPEEYVGEIDYWVWGDYEARCTDPFFELYPNVKINFVRVSNGDFFTKLQTAIAAQSDMPDIGNLEQTPRRAWFNLDCWERLDAAPYNMDTSVLVDWSLPLMTNERGEIVCAQIDNCIGGVVYNRGNTQELWGVSEVEELEAKFQTVEDYLKASEDFKGKDLGYYMYAGVQDVWSAFFQLFPEQYVTEDNVLNFEAAILPTFEIIETMVANDAVGDITDWTPQWSAAFATDYATFYSGVTWMVYDNIVPNNPPETVDKFGLITPPGGGFNQGGTALAIAKSAPQENKEIAWEFIRWFALSEGGAQAFLDYNHAPTLYEPFYTSEVYTTAAGNDATAQDALALVKDEVLSQAPELKDAE